MAVNMKAMIADALVKLSCEKDIDRITVKDLVETCHISRQSFYYHFRDILEVIEWATEQAFQKLLDRSLETDDPEAVFRDFIVASEESNMLLRKLLKSQRREEIERLMVCSVRTCLKELMERRGPKPDLPYEETEVALSFCTYGIVGLLMEANEKKPADRNRLAEQMHRFLAECVEETQKNTC